MKKRFALRLNQVLPWCAGIPLVLACWGYLTAYIHTAQPDPRLGYFPMVAKALFRAVTIYGLSVDEAALGSGWGYWQIEIARWLALIVTTSVFVNLLRMSSARLSAQLRSLNRNAVALHGDENLVALLKRELGARAIAGAAPERFKARTHILAFQSEKAMYDYLIANHESFFVGRGKSIYLCTLKAMFPSNRDGGIFVSNMAENCARLYWEERYLRRDERRVAIIGFGEYGRQLLSQALMVNVFAQCREIRYTVYGDGEDYLSAHPKLGEWISVGAQRPGWDSIEFIGGPWERNLGELKAADRIIACANSDEENLQTLDRLIEHGVTGKIDVRVVNAELPRRLWHGDEANIGVFGTDDRLYTTDVIMRESLLNRAKLIHARYMRRAADESAKCDGKKCDEPAAHCRDCDVFRESWEKLGGFKRGSNIAQADHMSVKAREVLGEDTAMNEDAIRRYKRTYDSLRQSEKRRFMELEHVHWMRYHQFHGWAYAPERDDARKLHNLLLPYADLPEEHWIKDEDAYVMIPEICAAEWGARKRGRK